MTTDFREPMTITDAKYQKNPDGTKNVTIQAMVNGTKMWIPIDEGNRHYQEITLQVEEGTLTIEEAD